MFDFFRKVDFPAPLELDLKELAPFPVVSNMRIVGNSKLEEMFCRINDNKSANVVLLILDSQ